MSTLLEQASLVMIPSGYKEDVVYSQIPTSGAGDLSFTRASNGTRINSAGLVEVVAWNLYSYSEDFTDGSWTKENCTISSNVTTAPNGTTTADKLILNNGVSAFGATSSGLRNTLSIAENIYTYSVYCKASEITSAVIRENDSVGSFMIVSLSDGAITYSGGSSQFINPSVENIGNGWFRIIWTSPNTITSANKYSLRQNVNGNGTSGFFVWGYQLNIGSTAKPYFPTTDRLNVPRLTYQNGGGGCPSLLLEKQSTNYALWSEAFTNGVWATYYGTTADNQAISPDGTQNAAKVTLSSGGFATLRQSISGPTNGQPYTFSLYIKQGSGVTGFLDIGDTTGTVNITPTSEWVRYTYTANWNTSLNFVDIELRGTDSSSYCYIWGAQLEAGSYATSMINTTSSSATRVADACFKTGISSLIGQTEGTIFLDGYFQPNDTGWGEVIRLQGASSGDSIVIYFNPSGQFYFEMAVGGVSQASGYLSYAGGRLKIAIAYANNDVKIYINGTEDFADTSASIPTCSSLYLLYGPSAQNKQGQVNQTALFKTRLTNAELASLTTI